MQQIVKALEAASGGQDIQDKDTFLTLLKIKKKQPELLITYDVEEMRFMGRFFGPKEKFPYMWAELTEAGKAYLSQIKKENCP